MFKRLAAMTVFAVLINSASHLVAQGTFQLVSATPADVDYYFGVHGVTMSDDGRLVASAGHQLDATGAIVSHQNVIVWNRATGEASIASVGLRGQPANGDSRAPALSPDGSVLAFVSDASNLMVDDTNNQEDLFLRDLSTGMTTRITPDLPSESFIVSLVVSAAGRVVAFSVVTGTGEWRERRQQIYVIDLLAGITTRVPLPEFPPDLSARFITAVNDITPDGRYVVFSSTDPLVEGDLPEDQPPPSTVSDSDVFLLDRLSGAIERISVVTSGTEGQGSSGQGQISDDARFVAFWSEAANLTVGDTMLGYGSWDIYLRDRLAETTVRVSPDRSATEPNSQNNAPAISGDGRFVVFQSQAILDEGPADLFVYDTGSGMTTRIVVDAKSNENDFLSPVLSGDGRLITFMTAASLVPADTDLSQGGRGEDVYVYDRGPQGDATSVLQTIISRLDSSSRWTSGVRAKLQAVLSALRRGNSAAACGPLKAAVSQARKVSDVALSGELRGLTATLGCGSANGPNTSPGRN